MIDLSEVSYGEILDCIVDASLGRLSPYFQEYNNTQNHTYLNEQRLEPSKPTQFHAGDTIRMADIVFSVVAGA